MLLEQTPFYDEVMDIGMSASPEPAYKWLATVKADDKIIFTHKVVELNVKRDYINAFAEVVTVTVTMLPGDVIYDMLPHRDALEVTLSKQYLDANQPAHRFTYKALVNQMPDVKVNTQQEGIPTQDKLNLLGPTPVTFSLIRKSVLELKGMTVGITYRKIIPGDVLVNIMTSAIQQVNSTVEDGLDGVDADEFDNQTETDHVIIPQPTNIIDVPGYIQKRCNGVYNNGMAFFIQDRYMKIFAPFNIERLDYTQRTLTLYRIPSKRFDLIENTSRLRGDHLAILTSGTPVKPSTTDSSQLNEGVGVRYLDASKVMDGSSSTEGNKVVMSRGDIVNEYTSNTRKDGFNAAFVSETVISSNQPAQRSKISARRGSVMRFTWERAHPDLITPGMPAKIVLLDGDQLVEHKAVVICTDTQYTTVGQVLTASRHKAATAIYLYFDPLVDSTT